MILQGEITYWSLVGVKGLSVYEAQYFISLLRRAIKMMKNGVYFVVIAFLVAELFKILVYAN